MPSYCDFVATQPITNIHRVYHDTAYGFPLKDDNLLFERLILEINQAGLNWETILKKQASFKLAYDGFDIKKIASYTSTDEERLLQDSGIIRNRLKIKAAIHNAKVILSLQNEHGSFENWLELSRSKALPDWTKLFRQTFKFTGGEIVKEFLQSTGYIDGAHDPACPIYKKLNKLDHIV